MINIDQMMWPRSGKYVS